VLPSLRAGNYAEGIETGIVSARERLITPFLAGTPVSVSDGFEDTDGPSSGTSLLLGLGAVAGLAGLGFWRKRRARRTCPKCGALTLERSSEVIQQPTPGETGLGMQHLSCSACGFNDHKSYMIPWSRREGRQSRSSTSGAGSAGRSSGSGRGFGGGRSSGGGASGKW
jgi:uncharacterized protein